MRNADIPSSLFWLVIGAGISLGSLKYGFGTVHQPGPGFITFFAGAILSFLSILLFLSSLKDSNKREKIQNLWTDLDVRKVVYVILLLILYTLFLKGLGFLISTFLLLLLLFRVKGSYRLRTVLFMSLVITLGSYMVFDLWLKAQLPKGIFELF